MTRWLTLRARARSVSVSFCFSSAAGAGPTRGADCDARSRLASLNLRSVRAYSTRRRLVGANCDGRSSLHGTCASASLATAAVDMAALFDPSFRVRTCADTRSLKGLTALG